MLLKQRAQRICCGRYGRHSLNSVTIAADAIIFYTKNVISAAIIVHISA